MSEKKRNDVEETEMMAPGMKVSSRVGGEIANDREATEEEIRKGDFTKVVNLSND